MNDLERWIGYHGGAFPGFAKWIANNPDQLQHIRRVIGHYSFDELKVATDTLYAEDPHPTGYSKHAPAVRRLCNTNTNNTESAKEGPKVIDGHLTARCPRCQDYGLVTVLTPTCLKQLWADYEELPLATCTIACNCELGSSKARAHRLPLWDEDRYCLISYESILLATMGDDKSLTEWGEARRLLVEWDQQRRQPQELTGEVLPFRRGR